MVRIVEAEVIGNLAYGLVGFGELFLDFRHYGKLDVLGGSLASLLFYKVAEIVWRQAYFVGAILDRREPVGFR